MAFILENTVKFLLLLSVFEYKSFSTASPLISPAGHKFSSVSALSYWAKGRFPQKKIVGGTDATLGEFPWQVSLQKPQPGTTIPDKFCGGVIFDSRTILTAAHCFETAQGPVPANTVTVVAGIINIENPNGSEQKVLGSSVRPRPDFDPETWDNDLAVLTLSAPLRFGPYVNSTPIAGSTVVPTGVCTAVGWGDTLESDPTPDVLQKVDLDMVTREDCGELWGEMFPFNPITIGMICANRAYKGTCHGDSGSGFICTDRGSKYLAGLVSWGQGECASDPDLPSVFTNIAHYASWIGTPKP